MRPSHLQEGQNILEHLKLHVGMAQYLIVVSYNACRKQALSREGAEVVDFHSAVRWMPLLSRRCAGMELKEGMWIGLHIFANLLT